MKKSILIFTFLICCIISIAAQSSSEISSSKPFVASTSWVASIAELGGIDDVVCIAPANLKHPPEYEITPQDIITIANSELFMQAGYEEMMNTISAASGIDKDKIIKVKTTNTLSNLQKMTETLSARAGTQKKAQERFSEFKALIENARTRIANSKNKDIEVFANSNQAEFARDLGLNVVSTFGPAPLTSDQIAEAAVKKYILVLDNFHNPVASPISEVSNDSIILVLKNFPDHIGGNALFELTKDNLQLLWNTGLFDN